MEQRTVLHVWQRTGGRTAGRTKERTTGTAAVTAGRTGRGAERKRN